MAKNRYSIDETTKQGAKDKLGSVRSKVGKKIEDRKAKKAEEKDEGKTKADVAAEIDKDLSKQEIDTALRAPEVTPMAGNEAGQQAVKEAKYGQDLDPNQFLKDAQGRGGQGLMDLNKAAEQAAAAVTDGFTWKGANDDFVYTYQATPQGGVIRGRNPKTGLPFVVREGEKFYDDIMDQYRSGDITPLAGPPSPKTAPVAAPVAAEPTLPEPAPVAAEPTLPEPAPVAAEPTLPEPAPVEGKPPETEADAPAPAGPFGMDDYLKAAQAAQAKMQADAVPVGTPAPAEAAAPPPDIPEGIARPSGIVAPPTQGVPEGIAAPPYDPGYDPIEAMRAKRAPQQVSGIPEGAKGDFFQGLPSGRMSDFAGPAAQARDLAPQIAMGSTDAMSQLAVLLQNNPDDRVAILAAAGINPKPEEKPVGRLSTVRHEPLPEGYKPTHTVPSKAGQ